MLEEKVFSGTASMPFQESFISYMSPDRTSQRVSTWSGTVIRPSLPGPCGVREIHSQETAGNQSPTALLCTGYFHLDPRTWVRVGHQHFSWWWGPGSGKKLGAREEPRKTKEKGWQGRGSQSRQSQEERGNEAFLTPRTAWRQVIYKSNFSLTTDPGA